MKARLAMKKEQAASDEVGSNKALEGGEGDSQKFPPKLAEGRVSMGHAEILLPPDTDHESQKEEEDERKRKKSAKKKKRNKDYDATDNELDVSAVSRSKSAKKKDKKSKSSSKMKKGLDDDFKKKVEEQK